jgi:hypothetical protein
MLGLLAAPVAALVGAVTALVVFAGYLAHPTWPNWTIYYMETAPVFAFYAVCGFTVLLRAVAREPEREWTWARGPRAAFALLLTLVLTLPMIRIELRFNRRQHLGNANFPRRFAEAVAQLPPRSILFVRHAKWHEGHWSLVTNEPDFAAARTWIAYDRGDSLNLELMRRSGRGAFLFDQGRGAIGLYRPAGTAVSVR